MTKSGSNKRNWGFVGLTIVGIIIQLVFWLSSQTAVSTLNQFINDFAFSLNVGLAFSVLGVMIINRQPGNKVGWLMILAALAAAIPISFYLNSLPTSPTIAAPGIFIALWLDNWSWTLIIFPIFLIPLYFPNGRPPSPRWRWVTSLAFGLSALFAFISLFIDELTPANGSWEPISNPIGFIPIDWLNGPFFILWGIGLMVLVVSSVASLFVRYRRSKNVERQQIKWLLYAGALFAIYYGATFFLTDPDSNEGWGTLSFAFSMLAMPLAIAIAILRYQLYDIDVIIRRTVTYAILTASLGLVYFGAVVVLQTAVGRAAEEQSPLVIVFSTFLIAALFSPLRRRIQGFIDRRFYRRKYDAALTLAQFAQTARDEVDMDFLSRELVTIIQEALEPECTSLWIKPVTNHSHLVNGKNSV